MHNRKGLAIAINLSYFIAALAAVASAGGLFLTDLYKDPPFIRSAWRGNDLVTLTIIAPAMLFISYQASRGSLKGRWLLAGLLSFMLYNYAFYLFGAVFNLFFLLYIALFTLSIYALFILLWNTDVAALPSIFCNKTPRRWISIFLLSLALPLGSFELSQVVSSLANDTVPAVPPLIFALDLSLVIPTLILAAILLWQGKAWGYALSLIMLVKGVTYGLVLITATIWAATATGVWDSLFLFYIWIFMGSLGSLVVLLVNMKREGGHEDAKSRRDTKEN